MTSHITSTARRSRMHLVAAVAVSALLLTGCNSGGDPNSGGTSSVSPSASASPSPTPTATAAYVPASASGRAQNVPVPVLPEVAKTETKEGLEAFVSYWYSTLSYAYETGDTKPLTAVTGGGCANCESARGIIANWYVDGRWLEGGKIVTPAIETTFTVAADGNYQAIAQVQQSQLRAYKADGSMSESVVPSSDVAQIFMAIYTPAGWQLVDVQRLNG
jgi:predicted small secreted protein